MQDVTTLQVKVEYVRRHSHEVQPGQRESLLRNAQRKEFPGAQPVSLSSDNRHLVSDFRYAILGLGRRVWQCSPRCTPFALLYIPRHVRNGDLKDSDVRPSICSSSASTLFACITEQHRCAGLVPACLGDVVSVQLTAAI